MASLRHQGSWQQEERAVCDPAVLEETVRRKLGSDRRFAAYLGVGKGTARHYRLGRLTLPMSFFKKLQILNPSLRPAKITDAYWGQGKGGTLRTILHEEPRRVTDCDKSQSLDTHDLRSKHCRTLSVILRDIGTYDAVPPSLILETALAKHKPALAEFIGRLFGDGSPILAPTYSASEIESQKRMQSLVVELFGYNPKIKLAKGHYRLQLGGFAAVH